jgi:hypothetical protein
MWAASWFQTRHVDQVVSSRIEAADGEPLRLEKPKVEAPGGGRFKLWWSVQSLSHVGH